MSKQMTERDYYRFRGQKYETPRGATPCRFGVTKSGSFEPPHTVDCGKPAVAEWDWGGERDPLPACEEHDAEARDHTPPEEPGVMRTPIDQTP